MSVTMSPATLDTIERQILQLRKKYEEALTEVQRARFAEGEALDLIHLLREEMEQLKSQIRTRDEMIKELQEMVGRAFR